MMPKRCRICGRFARDIVSHINSNKCTEPPVHTSLEEDLRDLELSQDKAQEIDRLAKDLWRVTSASNPGQYYCVQRMGNWYQCDCKGWSVRKHCSHSTRVRMSALKLKVPNHAKTIQLIVSTPWVGKAQGWWPKEIAK